MDDIEEMFEALLGRTIEGCGVSDEGDFFLDLDGDDTFFVGMDDDGDMVCCFGTRELDA